jgi:cytochrome c oxidase subunit I+III
VLAGVLALLMRAQLALPDNTLVARHLQPALHHARHGDDVPVRRAGRRGRGGLPAAQHAGRARPALPAPVGLCLLGLRHRRLAFFCTLFFGASPDGGWFMYPPLTGKEYSPGRGADWWLLGIGFIEISAIAGAIELIVGVLFTRAPGMHADDMPLFAWAMLGDGLMIASPSRPSSPAPCCWSWSARSTGPSSSRRAAATRCCGSTCSGSSATPRSTSSSCPRPAWSR